VHSRHGDVLKIATAADFRGTRWMSNAFMPPVPPGEGKAFMMPVARVMGPFRAHVGTKAVGVAQCPADLDVTASRRDNRVFLHVVNTHRTRSMAARLTVRGMSVRSGKVLEIAADPEFEVWSDVAAALAPKRKELGLDAP